MDPPAPPEEIHPTIAAESPPPPPIGSTTERMLEAVEAAMATKHPTPSDPSTAIGEEDVEMYLANVVTRGCQVVVSAQRRALEAVVRELEQVLSFMRVGYPVIFSVCFEARGWPNTEIPEMRQEWTAKEPVAKS